MHSPWPVHTVVLDLDDTLYPERDFVLSGFSAVDTWLRAKRGAEGFREAARNLFSAGHRGRVFDEALALIGVPADPELIATIVDVYRTHCPQLQLFPDAERLIDWAGAVGLRLALVTDGFAVAQRAKIAALALDRHISCSIVTDELGGRAWWKPHPEAFRRVMAAYPGTAAGYVYIADNPRKDFLAPRRLGWRTLRIRRVDGEHGAYDGSQQENAEREVATLDELRDILVPVQPWP